MKQFSEEEIQAMIKELNEALPPGRPKTATEVFYLAAREMGAYWILKEDGSWEDPFYGKVAKA